RGELRPNRRPGVADDFLQLVPGVDHVGGDLLDRDALSWCGLYVASKAFDSLLVHLAQLLGDLRGRQRLPTDCAEHCLELPLCLGVWLPLELRCRDVAADPHRSFGREGSSCTSGRCLWGFTARWTPRAVLENVRELVPDRVLAIG